MVDIKEVYRIKLGKYPIISVNPFGLLVFIKIVKFGNKIQKKIITNIYFDECIG